MIDITGMITAAVDLGKNDLIQAIIIIIAAIIVAIERIILRNPKFKSVNGWLDLIRKHGPKLKEAVDDQRKK